MPTDRGADAVGVQGREVDAQEAGDPRGDVVLGRRDCQGSKPL